MGAVDLSYVIITHNDAGRLGRAVSSAALAAAARGLDYEVWVVDNGSADHTGELLAALGRVLGPRLRVIRLPRNTGTTYPRNLALSQAAGNIFCVMDSDAEIKGPGLARAMRLLAEFPRVGIAAPRIVVPGRGVYDSAKLLPTLPDKLAKLPGILLGKKTINRDWYPDFPFERIRCVHTAISCCWLLRRDTFQRVGPLDERIFYSPEDVDYCLRCWRAGRAVVYFPGLTVLHHTRQVSHRRPLSRLALSHLGGLLYYYAKHHYWLSRRRPAARFIAPLAAELDPLLARWEGGQ